MKPYKVLFPYYCYYPEQVLEYLCVSYVPKLDGGYAEILEFNYNKVLFHCTIPQGQAVENYLKLLDNAYLVQHDLDSLCRNIARVIRTVP
jgi:hypothetical protein